MQENQQRSYQKQQHQPQTQPQLHGSNQPSHEQQITTINATLAHLTESLAKATANRDSVNQLLNKLVEQQKQNENIINALLARLAEPQQKQRHLPQIANI